MLRNREFRTRIVPIEPDVPAPAPEARTPFMTPDNIAVVKDFVKTTAIFVGGAVIITKIVDAGCEIAVRRGTPQ